MKLTARVGIDDQERLSFLTSLADKVNKPEFQDAYAYALADVANVKQRLQDFDGAKKDLEMCQRILDSFDAVETVVHASFYKVNADYYHVSTIPYYKLSGLVAWQTDNRESRPNKSSPPSTRTPSFTSPA